ncbi:MAG: DUF58 domain-containing protein [Methylococcales bacterium]|nr:DUF58 domain-containing protein [Methylococcales bacterium]
MLKKSTVLTSERVSASLKTLIDLAQPAAGLNLKRLSMRSSQSGGYVSRFKGLGMDFEESRMYQAGDDIRSIDWRVTARTGETHTKVFREERERPVFISVDNRAAMHFATRGVFKAVLAVKLAGLIAWAAQHQGDRIGGQLFSDSQCSELKPQNGKHAVLRFLNTLANGNTVSAEAKPISLEQVLARLAQHVHSGSLVYIISDFRGINDAAELHLAKLSQHCEVVLIFIYDALESNLPTKGRYRFTDEHRDVVIDTSDSQRLSVYHQHFEERLNHLQQLAKKRGFSFMQCSTVDNPVQCLR